MNELGRYDLSNSNLININNSENDNVSISKHEDVHRTLCGLSSYGILIMMMQKSRLFEPSHNWLLNDLMKYMSRMQERIATTIEYLTIHKEQGEQEFQKRIAELKDNTKYYNYLRRLLHSNMKLDGENIKVLLEIGKYSLNINLSKIPFEDFTNEKDFQRFTTQEGNNFRYLPNIRFDTLFNVFFRQVNDNEIEKKLGYIEDGTVNSEEFVKCAGETIRRIYSQSPVLPSIIERVNTIGVHECENYEGVSTELLSSYPIDLNNGLKKEYEIKRLEYNKFWDKFNEYDKDSVVIRFEHLMGGIEQVGFISLWDLKNSVIYSTDYPIEKFNECVKRAKCPIIFVQNKLFKKVKYKIRGLSYSLPVYLFMDGAISGKIEFILKHFKGGNYTYFQCGNYVTLVVFRGIYVLVQFIIVNLVRELDNLLYKTANIKFIEYQEVSLDKRLLSMISEESMKLSSYSLSKLDSIE